MSDKQYYEELLLYSNILLSNNCEEFVGFFEKWLKDDEFIKFIKSKPFVKLSLLQNIEHFIHGNKNKNSTSPTEILRKMKRRLLDE